MGQDHIDNTTAIHVIRKTRVLSEYEYEKYTKTPRWFLCYKPIFKKGCLGVDSSVGILYTGNDNFLLEYPNKLLLFTT